MNFRNLPEVDWRYGYATAAVLTSISTLGTYYYFKRKKWL